MRFISIFLLLPLFFLSGCAQQLISAVDIEQNLNYPTLTINSGVAAGIYDSDISADGKYLYVLNSEGSNIEVRDAKTGAIIKRVRYDVGDGNAGFVHSLVSAGNYKVIISSRNNNLYLIDVVSETVLKTADMGAYFLKMIPNRDKSKAILIYAFRTNSDKGRDTTKYSYIIDTSTLNVVTRIETFKCNYRIPFCSIFDIGENKMPYTAAAFGENGDFYLAATYLLYHHKSFDDQDGTLMWSEKGDNRIVGLEALPGNRLAVATDRSTVKGTGSLAFYSGKDLQIRHELSYTTDDFDKPDNPARLHYIPIKYNKEKNLVLSQGKFGNDKSSPGMLLFYDATTGRKISSAPLITGKSRFNSADMLGDRIVAVNSTSGISSVDATTGKSGYFVGNSFSTTNFASKEFFHILDFNPVTQELFIHRNKDDYRISLSDRNITSYPAGKIKPKNVTYIKCEKNSLISKSNCKDDDNKTYTKIILKNGNYLVNSRKEVVEFDKRHNELRHISNGFRNINGISINDSEDLLGIVGNSNRFVLVDMKSGEIVFEKKLAHNNTISDVRFSGGMWITASYDGMIRFWPARGGEHLISAAFSSVDDKSGAEDFIVTTRDGFFDVLGNAGSWSHFSVAGSMSIFSYNQLFETFFRPDIIKKTLTSGVFNPVPLADYSKPLNMPPPELAFDVKKTGKNSIELKVALKDAGGGIGPLRISNNGKLIHQSNDHFRITKSQETQPAINDSALQNASQRSLKVVEKSNLLVLSDNPDKYNLHLEMPFKSNNITLQAFNKNGSVMSMVHEVSIESEVLPPTRAKLHVISIGINKFVDPTANLGNAVKDANEITRIFSKYSAYELGEVITLTDEKASKNNIVETFSKLNATVKANDLIVVYFATHAYTDDKGVFYLFTHDYNGSVSSMDTIMYSELLRLHINLPAYRQVWFFDTCYSGGINNAVTDVYNSRSLVFSRASGMYVVTSSTAGQQASDNYDGYGLLTHLLGKLLNSSQGNKTVNINEVIEHITRESKKITSSTQIATATVHGENIALLNLTGTPLKSVDVPHREIEDKKKSDKNSTGQKSLSKSKVKAKLPPKK